MNGKDKISVIIPCYNVQKYIMRCFDSIYSQTYGFENLEVILIDDLSTDNTWSILESLQRKYPENVISLKIQKKGKCGGARNLGMDICTGKYITFVDADDYVHPDMLKESEYADMAEALNLTLAMPHLIDEALAMQKKAAVAADATDYMEILHL